MIKREFFLSKGSLKPLAERESLFDACSSSTDHKHQVLIRLDDPRPLVQIVDIEKFQEDDGTFRIGCILFDGQDEIPIALDENSRALSATSDLHLQENEQDIQESNLKLNVGSIITLNRYIIIPFREFTSECDNASLKKKPNNILCLKDYTIIGRAEPLNCNQSHTLVSDVVDADSRREVVDSISCNTINKNNEQKITHTIAEFDTRLSKSSWSFKCRLMTKSLVRKFENRTNGQPGRVMRILLLDKTAQVECVVFNEHCDNKMIQEMELNKFYIIKNADIKYGKPKLKAWSEQCSINYEVHVTSETEILLSKQDDSDVSDDSDKECEGETKKKVVIEQKTNITKNNQSASSSSFSSSSSNHHKPTFKLHEKFTKLNQLINKRVDSLVDVIGVIDDVGKIKTLKKDKSLSLLNFDLIDETKTKINVAIWGKQAEDFSLKPGTVLLLNDVKITNFGGISLSIMRATEILEMKVSYDVPIVYELFNWWTNSWNKSNKRKNHLLSQFETSNIFDESEDELENQTTLKKKRTNERIDDITLHI